MPERQITQEVEPKLLDLVREQLKSFDDGEDEALEPEDDLFHAGLDSMAVMQLLLQIHNEFGVDIPAAELTRKNFTTVSSIARLIERCST